MKFLIYLFLFLAPLFSKAGANDSVKIISLHPLLGNTIDLKEKKEFSLFPEYKDNVFESAEILKYNDSTYTISFKTTTGKTFEKPTSTKELDKMYAEIEHLKPTEYVNNKKNFKEEKPTRNHHSDSGYWIGELLVQVIVITLGIMINSSH